MERKLVRKWVRNNTKKGGGPAEPSLQQISGDGWSGVRCKQVGEPQLFGNLLFGVVIQNNFSREFLRIDEEIVTIAQVQL